MITVVSGLGRCGSSLVMQMLSAGGFPCVGFYPAFEVEHPAWEACEGKAVKVLDPHRVGLPHTECRIIWLERDLREQAKSTLKMQRALGMEMHGNRRKRLVDMVTMLTAERAEAVRVMRAMQMTTAVLPLRYEALKRNPTPAIQKISGFVGGGLDLRRMSACLRNRRTDCIHGLLEMGQLREVHR